MNDSFDVITLSDGGIYMGDVSSDGKPHGAAGTGIWKSKGMKYIGHWLNGKMHGTGTMYYLGDRKVYGVWYEGELIYEFVKSFSDTNDFENFPDPSHKQKITALLIGNNEYPTKPLRNCVNDVRAIGKKLQSIGVDVKILENATKSEMVDAIRDLGEKSNNYDHVFFFYSGHGISNQGRHYLSAIDESTDESPMLSLEKIDEYLSSQDFEDIIIVSDACCVIVNAEGNTDPVVNNGKTLMAFSTTMGQYSFDGKEPNSHSPFAIGLLEYIDKPMEVVQMFREVNRLTTAIAEREIGIMQMPTLLISPLFPSNLYLCPRYQ